MPLSIGKWRRLQQASLGNATFCILAMDHRGPLRRLLQAELGSGSRGHDLDALLAEWKQDVARDLGECSSAVLLDPELGIGPSVAGRALSGQRGLIAALDTGSTGDPAVRETGLVADWSVAKAARLGAAGVKLLMYYHPDSPSARDGESLVRSVASQCDRYDIPLFLEPLSCAPDHSARTLSSRERCAVVVETARRLVPLGVDVLKAEFPVDVTEQPEENAWHAACQQLTDACSVPWVLLSGGVSFDTFLRQTRVACEAGASGVMVGRAVWKEAVTSDRVARRAFLCGDGQARMHQLSELCASLARPFCEIYPPPVLDGDWYRSYSGGD